MTGDRTPVTTAALILGAGPSSRMGRPKQLLDWHGKPLIRRVAEQALASRAAVVAAVLGSGAPAARAALDGLAVAIVENPRWSEGLGTSLARGVQFLVARDQPPDAVIVLLADQPFVSAGTIDRLIETRESTGRPLVAALHEGEPGVPALFSSRFFAALVSLDGDHGAQQILLANADLAALLDLPEAVIDLDTPADYEASLQKP